MIAKNINEDIFNRIKIDDVVNIVDDILKNYTDFDYKIKKSSAFFYIYFNEEVVYRINIFNGSIFIKDEILFLFEDDEGFIDRSEKCTSLKHFKECFENDIDCYYKTHLNTIKYNLGFIKMIPCFNKDNYSNFIYELYKYNENILNYSHIFRKYLNAKIEDKLGYIIDAKKNLI